MERKYNTEIEGLMVEITYDFTEGDKGDWMTPPTGDMVDILGWKLLYGEDTERKRWLASDDEEWREWMSDINHYVYNESMWDILEWENKIRDIDFGEN